MRAARPLVTLSFLISLACGDGAAIPPESSSTGGQGGLGGQGGQGGHGGQGGDACPSSCTDADGECMRGVCQEDGTCRNEAVERGVVCADGVCDGAGRCVAPSCVDGLWNHAETDRDCGGPDCAPCERGLLCKGDGDCDGDVCVDGRCCESACDALCEACSEAKTGVPNGLCAPITAGTDPDDECGDVAICEAESCSGSSGSCEIELEGTVCRPSIGGVCDPDEVCDGARAVCPPDIIVPAGQVQAGLCSVAELCDDTAVCSSMHAWSKGFGDSSDDSGDSVRFDAQGNVVVTGYFNGTVNLGGTSLTSAGSADVFVAKYSAAGAYIWSRRFGGSSSEFPFAVAIDSQGAVVVAGTFQGTVDFGGGPLTSADGEDIFVAKYSAAGSHIWSQRFGGEGSDRALAVAIDNEDNVLVAGYFNDTVDFGGTPLTNAGGADVFVAKLGATGAHVWSQRFGNTLSDIAAGLAVDAQNNVVVVGAFRGEVDFGGGALVSAGDADGFVAKYGSTGGHLWSRRFGAALADSAVAVDIDSQDEVVIAGSFRDTVDLGGGLLVSTGAADTVVAKYSAAGTHIWSRSGGGAASSDSPTDVVVDGQGNVVLSGWFAGAAGTAVDFGGGALVGAGGQDTFVVKYAATGAHLWSQSLGGSSLDIAYGLAVDAQDNIAMTGFFSNTVDFGGGSLTSAGSRDVLLVKYDQ